MATEEKDVLKILSARAVLEFEDVQQKYKQYFEKCKQEEAKRRKLESQFKQLKQVSLLAVAEYESLHKQYVTENEYRIKIEEQLKKTQEENQEIRKQSKLGANTTIVPATNQTGNGLQETKGELEVLRAMKDAINTELRNAKNEVTKLKEELESEQKAHDVTKRQLELGAKQMKQLNRVSVLALNEFTDMKKKLEVEELNRKTAEEMATDLVQKNEKNERAYSIIVETAEKDEQIKKFMEEIDELHNKIAAEKQESTNKINELEEELKNVQSNTDSKALEEKVSLLMEQLDIAQKQLIEAESRVEKSESDARQLYTRLALAERALESENAHRVPLPPPPPPPPPPIAAPVIRKFITRIGKKKKSTMGLGDDKEEDPRIEAMSQMIDRIKKGVKLRSVASPIKPAGEGGEENEEGAMGELAGLLSSLRRGKADHPDSVDVNSGEKQAPEFARLKLKKADTIKRVDSTENLDNTSSELRQKLERQKSVADGIDKISTTDDEENKSSLDDKNVGNEEAKKGDANEKVSEAAPSTEDNMPTSTEEKSISSLVSSPTPPHDAPPQSENIYETVQSSGHMPASNEEKSISSPVSPPTPPHSQSQNLYETVQSSG